MSRLIDADALCKKIRKIYNGYMLDEAGCRPIDFEDMVDDMPTAFDTKKVVEQLEEKTDFLKDCTKYGNKDAEQQEKSYSTMMMYEIADLVEDLIDIVKKGGVINEKN